MKKWLMALLTFVMFWFTAWLAGFNFDERNLDVAWWFAVSVGLSVLVFSQIEDGNQ